MYNLIGSSIVEKLYEATAKIESGQKLDSDRTERVREDVFFFQENPKIKKFVFLYFKRFIYCFNEKYYFLE